MTTQEHVFEVLKNLVDKIENGTKIDKERCLWTAKHLLESRWVVCECCKERKQVFDEFAFVMGRCTHCQEQRDRDFYEKVAAENKSSSRSNLHEHSIEFNNDGRA